MIFNKQKMLQWLITNGYDTAEYLADAEALDGKKVEKNNWKALVYNELEYYVTLEDGAVLPVLPEWCD